MLVPRFFLTFLISISFFTSLTLSFAADKNEEKLNPDKLQLLLDLTGEGHDPDIAKELDFAVQAAWAENTPYQRYMFVSAALDALGSVKEYIDLINKKAQETALMSSYGDGIINNPTDSIEKDPKAKEGKRAVACFASAEMLMSSLTAKELSAVKKPFLPGELELIKEDNPWKKTQLDDENTQLTAVIAGIFLHNLVNVAPVQSKPENLKGFDKIKVEFKGEATNRLVWKKNYLPIAKERILAIFKHWLPYTEEHAVVLEGLGDKEDSKLVSFKKDLGTRSKLAIGDLAVNIPKELIKNDWAFTANLPNWMKKAAESPYAVQITRQIFKTNSIEQGLSNSAMEVLKTNLKTKNNIDTALPATSLKTQFTDLFTTWKNDGFKNMKIKDSPIQLGTAFKAIGYGAIISAAVDLTTKMGSALIKGQQDQEMQVADRKVSYTPRNQQMQRSSSESLDKKRDKKYAFEDAWSDYKEHILSNSAGIVTGAVVGVAGTALVMGAAAAAGLPTAGVGGAVVGAAGCVVVGTASSAASKGVKKLISPVEEKVNDFLAKGKIAESVMYIVSDMKEYKGDKKTLRKKIAQDMEERYLAGHPHRFMSLIDSFDNIELEREGNGLVYFTMEHKNGNTLDDVKNRSGLVGGVKQLFRRKTTQEAHVRYEYFDAEENIAFWDGYSNRIIPCGSYSLNHNNLVFVGTDTQNIVYDGAVIKGTNPSSDVRVLSNGILMAKNEFSGDWEIRGKVFDSDIYVRAGQKTGRYTWSEDDSAYKLIFAGKTLARDQGLDEEGRGIPVEGEKKGTAGRTKVQKGSSKAGATGKVETDPNIPSFDALAY